MFASRSISFKQISGLKASTTLRSQTAVMAEVFLWAVPWVAGAIGISGALLAICEATNIMRSEHDVASHTVSALLQFDAANLVDLTDDNLKVLNGMVVEPSPNDDGKVRLRHSAYDFEAEGFLTPAVSLQSHTVTVISDNIAEIMLS